MFSSLFYLSQRVVVSNFYKKQVALAATKKDAVPLPATHPENPPGAQVLRRGFGIRGTYHEREFGEIAYGVGDLSELLMYKFRKYISSNVRHWKSESEVDETLAEHFSEEAVRLPHDCSTPEALEWIVAESYGALIAHREGDELVVDTRELAPFIRPGHDLLDCVVHLSITAGRVRLTSIAHGEARYTREQTSTAAGALAQRACVAAMFTIITLKYHLLYCHTEMADQYTTFAMKRIAPTHPLRRLLGFVEFETLRGNDQAILTLLDYTFPTFMNVDRDGMRRYLEYGKGEFDLFRFFHFPTMMEALGHGDEASFEAQPILHIAKRWWGPVYRFVADYVSCYFANEEAIDDATRQWMQDLLSMYGRAGGALRDAYIEVASTLIYTSVVHKLVFNGETFDRNPFRFTSRLRKGTADADVAGLIENEHETLVRSSVGLSVTLASVTIDNDFSYLAVDDGGARCFQQFAQDVKEMEIALADAFERNSILKPDTIACSLRW